MVLVNKHTLLKHKNTVVMHFYVDIRRSTCIARMKGRMSKEDQEKCPTLFLSDQVKKDDTNPHLYARTLGNLQ